MSIALIWRLSGRYFSRPNEESENTFIGHPLGAACSTVQEETNITRLAGEKPVRDISSRDEV